MRILFFYSITIFGLLSCQTWEASELRLSAAARLEFFQSEDRYAEIIGLLPSLHSSPYNTDALREASIEGMRQQYWNAVEEKEYFRQWHYQRNIALLDHNFKPQLNESELIRRIVFEEALMQEHAAALMALLSKINLSIFTTAELQILLERSSAYRAQDIGQQILSLLKERGKQIDVPQISNVPDDFDTLFKGVLTVIVDEGLAISRGIGERVIGGGSGFFIQDDGYLLTNYHVIEALLDSEKFSRLSILPAGDHASPIEGELISYDETFDLALLKVDMESPQFFSLSSARKPSISETVFVLGSPLGLRNTLTSGIMSVNDRVHFLQMGDELQYDAATNPGNSGGPLIDREGNVLGIAYAKIFGFEGINFAIPSYWVQFVVPRLFEAEDSVTHSWLGLGVRAVSDTLEVRYVAPNSPAEDAGMRVGDILLEINGIPTTSPQVVQEVCLSLQEGALVELRYSRDDRIQDSLLATAERPKSPTEYGLGYDSIAVFFPLLFDLEIQQIEREFLVTDLLFPTLYSVEGMKIDDAFKILDWHIDTERNELTVNIKLLSSKGSAKRLVLHRGYYDAEHYI